MPSLKLSIALGIVRRGPHVAHPAEAYKRLEIPGNKLWTIIGDNPGMHPRALFSSSLNDNLHVSLFHTLTDLTVHNISTVAVQDRTQIVKGPANVYMADIYMPMLVRSARMLKAVSLLGNLLVPLV